MRKFLLLSLFLVLFCLSNKISFAQNTEWVLIWDDEDISTYFMYDPASIEMDGTKLKITMKLIPYDDYLRNGKEVNYLVQNIRIDCPGKYYETTKETIFYADSTSEPGVIVKPNKQKLRPEKPIEAFYSILCSN